MGSGRRDENGEPTHAQSSIELIRRARLGDRQAMDHLFDRYLPALRRWASGRLPRWARDLLDTDDIVQETLLHTIGNVRDFEPRREGALHAYLRRAVHNRVHDEVRRVYREPPRGPLPAADRDGGASPLEEAIGREAIVAYEEALARLAENEREAIVARIEMGLAYGDVARLLGKPSADAARMAVKRALVRLAREMNDG
jgi:RNA polymerase sigma-70 factor (ECF subfamily)